MIDDDLDVFLFGILELPVGGLEESARLACHNLDVFCPQPERGTATIHRGIADTDDQHVVTDLLCVPEGDGLQPVDTNVNVFRVVTPWQLEFLAARRAGTDEYGVEATVVQQVFQAVDAVIQLQIDAHVEDVIDFLVEHLGRQAELRNIGTHEAAGRVELFEHRDLVTERYQVVGDGQRRTSGADQRDLLAVCLIRRLRQPITDVITVIGGDPFQPADRHRLVFHTPAATRRLAGTIADSPQNCREHIRFPVQHIGLGKLALRDQANIVRHVGVRRASPLAVDNFVEVLRLGGIGWLHSKTTRQDFRRCCPDISAVQNPYFA